MAKATPSNQSTGARKPAPTRRPPRKAAGTAKKAAPGRADTATTTNRSEGTAHPAHLPIPTSRPANSKARFADLERAVNELFELFQTHRLDPEFREDFAQLKAIGVAFNNRDFDSVVQLIGELDNKYAHIVRRLEHVEAEQKRLHRGLTNAHQRSAKLEERTDKFEQKLDELGLSVTQIREALEAGQIGGRKAFWRYTTSHGVSEEQIRSFFMLLDVDGEVQDLTDEELFHELLTTVMSDRAETDRRLNRHEERLDTIDTSVTTLHTRVESVEATVNTLADKAKDVTPYLAGLFAAVIVGLFIWPFDRLHGVPWYNELGAAVLVGAIVGIVVSLFVDDGAAKAVNKTKRTYEERKVKKAAQSKSTQSKVETTEGSDNPKGTLPEGASEPSDASDPEPASARS